MGQIANVEYFYLKCNQVLGTNYSASNWGGNDNIKKPINIEWLALATNKVYQTIHQPKTQTQPGVNYGCTLKLSIKFNNKTSKLAVDTVLVNQVVNYLTNLNKICDNDCACYRNLNCHCDCNSHCVCHSGSNCSGPGDAHDCGNCSNCSDCNCTCSECQCQGAWECTCPNCDCECGSPSECNSNDCNPYECNCIISSTHCSWGTSNATAANCGTACNCRDGACECACNCDCDCEPPPDCTPTDCNTSTYCIYSYNGSSSSGSGRSGSVSVSGSSSTPTIPVSASECFINSYTGEMGTACSVSPDTVQWNGNQYQNVTIYYTLDGQSGTVGINALPQRDYI